MKKTKLTLLSIADGLSMYIVWYLWISLTIWLGFKLLNLIDATFLQVFGGLIVFRQIVAAFKNPTDKHVNKRSN